ncbi:MAG: hypothetical protein A2V85_04250 [Chloroflexi bacterium RBG_16_72_14]|nr:MAG: hypothetical protein A2V85_04250 [Chloroflexi bacterium RBG_16_72_14]
MAAVLLVAVLGAAVADCGGSSIPVISFDPASACTTDGRMAGAYPDLEAVLPTSYLAEAPDSVDSGRNCTPEALGTLAAAAIDEVRFAGATWDLGGGTALTVAAFEADGLTPALMIEFYETTARANRKTEKLVSSQARVGDRAGRRLDVLQSDGTGQTIVAWPSGVDGRVSVLLAADLGDTRVLAALEAFAAS